MVEKKKLTIKEKAQLYDNWLKYVDNRGWTDCFAEPQKIKEEFDKLKKEISYTKELNHGLSQACDILKTKNKKVLEENKKLKEKIT